MRKVLIGLAIAVGVVAVIAGIYALLYTQIPAVTEWTKNILNK